MSTHQIADGVLGLIQNLDFSEDETGPYYIVKITTVATKELIVAYYRTINVMLLDYKKNVKNMKMNHT